MHGLIRYFLDRPVVVNAIMFGLLLSSFFTWKKIGKEEMPEFAFNSVRINVLYPGASAGDVELFITKPIEEKLKGVSALQEISASSAYAVSSIRVYFEPTQVDLKEKVQEVKDAVDSVDFPREAEDPVYRQFKSSEKAIIDIGIYLKDVNVLDVKSRSTLQAYALNFKNRLLSLPEVSGVTESGYLRPELQIKVNPDKLRANEISMDQVRTQINNQNVRYPIGSLLDKRETELSLISELKDESSLNNVSINVGFQGQRLKLKDIAQVEHGFEKNTSIYKVQGHEGVILNIQKSSSTDILTAQKAINNFVIQYKKNNSNAPVDFIFIDDESYDVKNRLNLIGTNGLIGFILIVFFLFLFLDFRSGIWVAMGIPFSLGFTLIISLMLGYTVNNMTLASIIIVLGIVVDDAIIIAENISRYYKKGDLSTAVACVMDVGSPVVASVLTTCAAFIPLYFFDGRFGMFVKYIPTIIFLMLAASLIESFFILPAHMVHETKIEKAIQKLSKGSKIGQWRDTFLNALEDLYAKILQSVLKLRFVAVLGFVGLLGFSGYIFNKHLSYVMFPREESRDFSLKVVAPEGTKRQELAVKVREIEDVFLNDDRGLVTSVRTYIGQNRRGGEVKENEASVTVEILPPSERKITLNQMIQNWQKQIDQMDYFQEVKFLKSRFGSDSGSPLALEIQENNDDLRSQMVNALKDEMEKVPGVFNVEIEKPVNKYQFELQLDKHKIDRLNISYSDIASTLRTYIEGDVLYTLNNGDEEVDVRLTGKDDSKNQIDKISKLTVSNGQGYLVPISSIVKFIPGMKPATIQRVNYKRATMLYADIKEGSEKTPLDMAELIEQNVFPKILDQNPTTHIAFRGEVEESRESQSDFLISVLMALSLIYLLLICLFNSFVTPFLIAAIIPFGVVGTVMAFYFHGYSQYGFFAVVGTLGMMGVVINDAIVLINKLDKHIVDKINLLNNIAHVSSTRLRAIVMTTVTTVAGLFPTAYGLGGYDSMLAEMMLAMGWGLLFGMVITLFLVPCIYSMYADVRLSRFFQKEAL